MDIWKKPWFIPIVLTVIIIVVGQLYTSGKLTKAEALPEEDIRSQLETIYDGEVKELVLDGSVYKAIVTKIGAEYEVEVDAPTGKVLSLIQTKEIANPDIVLDTEGEKAEGKEETVPPAEQSADNTEKAADDKATEKPQSKNENKVQSEVTEKQKQDVNKTPAKPASKPESQPAKQEKQQKRVLISEQQAMNIGLNQLPAGTVAEVDDVDFVNSADGGYYLVEIDIDTEDDRDEVTYQIHAITGKVMTVTWEDE